MYAEVKEMPNGKLKISLTEAGWAEREELSRSFFNRSTETYEAFFHSLFDEGMGTGSIWGNGWDLVSDVAKGRCGFLTDSLVIGYDGQYDDDGAYEYGKVWWYPNYMIDCPIELLLDTGEVIFEC